MVSDSYIRDFSTTKEKKENYVRRQRKTHIHTKRIKVQSGYIADQHRTQQQMKGKKN